MSRSALVTGGTGGIGSAIVRRLRTNGYEVVFCGRDEQRAAAARARYAAPCSARPTRPIGRPATPRSPSRSSGWAGSTCSWRTPGVLVEGPLADTSDEEFELLVEVNLTSAFRYARAVFAPMRRQGSGVMVLIASDSAIRGSHRIPAYSVVKAGVVAIAELLGAEGAPYGIRANAVCPGNTLPGMAGDDAADWRPTASGAFATADDVASPSRSWPRAGGAHQRRDAAHRRRHGRRAAGRDPRLGRRRRRGRWLLRRLLRGLA